MISIPTFRKLALAFPSTTEAPHFEKISFRIKGKIFATCDEAKKMATIKLSETDQYVFSLTDPKAVCAVDNKWGKQGWTRVDLKVIGKELFVEILTAAYGEVAAKKK